MASPLPTMTTTQRVGVQAVLARGRLGLRLVDGGQAQRQLAHVADRPGRAARRATSAPAIPAAVCRLNG